MRYVKYGIYLELLKFVIKAMNMSSEFVPKDKTFKFNSKTQAAVHKSVVLYLKSQAGKDLLKDVVGNVQVPGEKSSYKY